MKHYKLTFLLPLLLSMASIEATAHDIAVANNYGTTIYYTWTNNRTALSVSYCGNSYYSYSNEYTGTVVIPASVTYNGTAYPVTSIGNYAFYDCTGLTSINIPNSVTSIGGTAFSYCSGLTSVTIGNSVTSIGSSAFSGCSGLTKVNISDVAAWCNINFGNSSSNPLSYAHHVYSNGQEIKYLVIPNSVTSISSYAFSGCSGLTSTTIPNSVTSIGSYAFQNCSGLTSVTIPNSITSIDGYVFYGCSSLTSATIPNSVTSIGSYAFQNCSGLTSVTIPNSVTSIGSYTFQNCSGLTRVNISDVAAWCNISFGDSFSNPLSYAHHLYLNGQEIQHLVIPNSVTNIANYAFYGCSGLTSVTISNSVTSIGSSAFSGCSGLTSVNIPNSVTSIGSYAFSACSALTSITIPSSVTNLSTSAFSGCTSLQYIKFSGSSNYTTIDGVVYDKNVTQIIIYPPGKTSTTYTYPSTITDFSGISNNLYLKKIYVPRLSTTPSINYYTFNVGDNLEAVEFADFVGNYYTKDGVVYRKSEYNGESYNYLVFCPRGKTSLTVTPDVMYIEVDGFRSNTKLESLTIEASERYLNFTCTNSSYSSSQGAFHSPLKNVYLGRRVYFSSGLYGRNVFADNPSLETVVVGENMTSIPSYLFTNCSGLTNVTLPETITSVGSDAFTNTPWLASLPVQDGIRYYNYIALEYEYSEETKNVLIKDGISVIAGGLFENTNVESVIFPISVTSLEDGLFVDCKSLKKVILPNSIKQIPSINIGISHYGSTSGVVENIHVPGSVTRIELYAINECDTVIIEDGNNDLWLRNRNADDGYWDGAFSGVKKLYVGRNTDNSSSSYSGQTFTALNSSQTQLTDLTFGPLVTKAFWGYDFRGCSYVTSVTCLGKEPFTSPDFFTIPQTAVLYVPLGSKQQYTSADGWSQFSNITEVTEVTITMDDTEMVYAGDFDLDFSHVDGLKAYTAGDYDMVTSTITLNPIQFVSAGKGVILKGAKGTYTVPCANIEPTAADPLCGTISGRFIRNIEDENVNYVFDKDEHVFKSVDAAYGCLISRNGAYLSLPTSSVSENGIITPILLEPTDISQMDNVIYIEPLEGLIGTTIPLEVKINNTEIPVGCSFRLALPSGFSLACDNDGDIVYELGSRARKMSFTNKDWGNGIYDFALTPSTSSTTISGSDGTVVTFQLIIPDDMPTGDYALTLTRNLIQRKVDGVTQDMALADILSKITVGDYTMGDVNGDGNITPSDAIMILYHYFDVKQNGFNVKAADINGDKAVTPADAIEALYLYFGSGSSNARMSFDNDEEPQ